MMWVNRVGSVYIRMCIPGCGQVKHIEQKVVKRLRSGHRCHRAGRRDRVNVIFRLPTGGGQVRVRQGGARLPRIVGDALARTADDPEIARVLFDVLEPKFAAQPGRCVHACSRRFHGAVEPPGTLRRPYQAPVSGTITRGELPCSVERIVAIAAASRPTSAVSNILHVREPGCGVLPAHGRKRRSTR